MRCINYRKCKTLFEFQASDLSVALQHKATIKKFTLIMLQPTGIAVHNNSKKNSDYLLAQHRDNGRSYIHYPWFTPLL